MDIRQQILDLMHKQVLAFYENDTLTAAVIAGQLSALIEHYFKEQP